MAEPVAVKRALARLASDADADRAVVEQADAAVDDLDAAVRFVEDVGVARLAVAVERQRRAGNADAVARGERTLEAFDRYRQAARATAGATSNGNGNVGGPFDGSPFEHGLESLGVGLQPVDGNGGSEQAGRTDGEPGAGAADDASASGWVTLDGDQFHSHSGYGNGLGTASKDGRR